MQRKNTVAHSGHGTNKILSRRGVAKGGARGGRPPPQSQKNHSLKKAKSVEKFGGGTRYILEAETD
jgi:hypothetical protein